MSQKDLARLWRQIVQDYEEIRREQELEWAFLTQEERIYLTEQLLLFAQEAERLEEQGYARDASATAPNSG
jgi:predicted ribosome-associated RNA-binding protein Tma20